MSDIIFELVSGSRRFPKDVRDWENVYIGRILIIQSSKPKHIVVGRQYSAKLNLPSWVSYFRYQCKDAKITNDRRYGSQITHIRTKSMCTFEPKPNLFWNDVDCLVKELMIKDRGTSDTFIDKAVIKDVARSRDMLRKSKKSIAFSKLVSNEKLVGQLEEKCDIVRLELKQAITAAFVPTGDSRNALQIEKLSASDLRKVRATLAKQPWKLVFWRDTFPPYGLLPIDRAAYLLAIRHLTCEPHIHLACLIYYDMKESRKRHKNTVFVKDNVVDKVLEPLPQKFADPLVIEAAFEHLMNGGAKQVNKQEIALHHDYKAGMTIVSSFLTIESNARAYEPELRQGPTPVHLPPLTQDQMRIAKHIDAHWITVMEGLPGTGKTMVVSWCLARYKNVMICSFMGMMVKTLQRRCGNRPESARTIHNLIAIHDFVPFGALWAAHFEVLIIDEFSNVDVHLLARLLKCLNGVCKIVFAGDHEQLCPIDAGDPMGDIKDVFGSLRLTEILRVEDGLDELREAPLLLSQNRATDIRFSKTHGPLRMLAKTHTNHVEQRALNRAKATLKPLFCEAIELMGGHSSFNVMMLHVITMVNQGSDGRVILNDACEQVFQELGVLKHYQQKTRVSGFLEIYLGMKITFTQNYNKPVTDSATGVVYSEPVGNGELGIIEQIEVVARHKGGGHALTIWDGFSSNPKQTKRVWLNKKQAVDPAHIEKNFVSTTYKIQGNEFPVVVFWMRDRINSFETREHAYVGISRGKQLVWVIGNETDFYTTCSRTTPKRNTLLSRLLQQKRPPRVRMDAADLETYEMQKSLTKFSSLLPREIPCVKTVQQFKPDAESTPDAEHTSGNISWKNALNAGAYNK